MGGRLMKKFELVIPLGGHRNYLVVDAYETDTPGLFVHRDIGNNYRWAVTHWSGTLVGGYEWLTRDEALHFAADLIGVAKWYRPIERLQETVSSFRDLMQTARMCVVGRRSGEQHPQSVAEAETDLPRLSEASHGGAA